MLHTGVQGDVSLVSTPLFGRLSRVASLEGGVYYTGRPDFQIGSDFFWSKIASSSSGREFDGIQFRLVTRIDF